MTQALTGHGAFAAYLKRFRLRDSDACPCDAMSSKDIRHLLLECGYTFNERQILDHACARKGLQRWPISLSSSILPTIVSIVNRILGRILPVVNAT